MPRSADRDAERGIVTSRFAVRDLVGEAVAGILQRPVRSVLTMLGTILGIGALIVIVGVSETAGAQISKQFNVLDATQVIVADTGNTNSAQPRDDFPNDADQRVQRLHGVVAAGVWWQVQGSPTVSALPSAASLNDLSVFAATPGLLQAIQPTISAGVMFNDFDERQSQDVVVLSASAAAQLGITDLENEPAVFIGGQPFTVVGIMASDLRLPQLGLGIVMPIASALAIWGPPPPADSAAMLIHTRLGAAGQIAHEAPVALRPDDPSVVTATAAANPTQLRQAVTANLNALFVILALVALVIGAVGIANITLVAILDRTGEIGLRRALGARPMHIAAQFLSESVSLGILGGLIGTAIGVLTTLFVALAKSWTAVLNPYVVVAAPFAGALVGLAAGLYPSLRAALIEPADALRR